MTFPRWAVVAMVAGVLASSVGFTAQAQLAIPALDRLGQTDSTLAITAGEAVESVNDLWARAEDALPITRGDVPRDSIRAITSAQAMKWLARLSGRSVQGLQSEPHGMVLNDGDEVTLAERAISARLKTPGLSLQDRAYAYYAAINAFANPMFPARVAVAEQYMAKLNALGNGAAFHRYLGELALVKTYDDMDRSADVARHGVAAIHLTPQLPMADNAMQVLHDPEHSMYPVIARAVSIQPNGKATLAALNTILKATATPVPDSVALDSNFYYMGTFYQEDNERMLKGLELVGSIQGPVYSNRWLNRPDSTPGAMAMNDGHVHVVLTANYGCGICVFAAVQLQRIVNADTAMRAVLVTWTDNMWGNKDESPDANAVHQTNFWVNEKQVHYPIALWIAHKSKVLADSSVVLDLSDDSTLAHYPESGKPQFYIIDKHGRIRDSFFTFDRQLMRRIVEVVHHLEQENGMPSGPSSQTAAGE